MATKNVMTDMLKYFLDQEADSSRTDKVNDRTKRLQKICLVIIYI